MRERVAEGCGSSPPLLVATPGLATVLVGDDPASHVYVGNKRKQTEEVGMRSFHHGLGAATPRDELSSSSPSSTKTTPSTASSCSCRFRSRSTRTR